MLSIINVVMLNMAALAGGIEHNQRSTEKWLKVYQARQKKKRLPNIYRLLPLLPSESPRSSRSSTTPYNRDYCIICQKGGGSTHLVTFMKTGSNMRDVAKHLADKGFFIRLNSISSANDAVASDARYHLQCWV